MMDEKELNEILEKHKHWINKDCECWESMRADLSFANLQDTDLRNAELSGAYLRGAYLMGADLRNADLREADLCDADLRDAKLKEVDLRSANLRHANLHFANLCIADLRWADLSDTDLGGSDLSWADFRWANLFGSILYAANLHNTDFRGANDVPYIPYACPEFGSFTGYKKASGRIVELEIQEDSKRVSATTRKCRCNKARVLGIYDYDHNKLEIDSVPSDRDKNFIYKVGEMITVYNFDDNRWNECSTGIHFFINFREAVDYR